MRLMRFKPPGTRTTWRLAELFHEDATFVNRFGHYVRGVEAIVSLHPHPRTIYRDSSLENELIDMVRSAMEQQSCTSGAASRPEWPTGGPHAVDTLILAVLTRRAEHGE